MGRVASDPMPHVGRPAGHRMPHVGRAATISGDMAKSNAMMLCHASLPSHYDLPDWFLDSLTKWLANLFDEEIVHELGKRLTDFQEEDML